MHHNITSKDLEKAVSELFPGVPREQALEQARALIAASKKPARRYPHADYAPYTFCHGCGTEYEEDLWPRVCPICNHEVYLNPAPVGVILAPVEGGGFVGVHRLLSPVGLALAGGYVDRKPKGLSESWQQACVRELYEEAGLVADADNVEPYWFASTPSGTIILLFGLLSTTFSLAEIEQAQRKLAQDIKDGKKTEVSAIEVIDPNNEEQMQRIVLPLHRQAIQRQSW